MFKVKAVESEQSAGRGGGGVDSGSWGVKKKKTPKETIMEKCKQSPQNSLDKKSQNIPPSCPQLSLLSFRSPPTAQGCQATAVLLKTVSGRRGASGRRNVEEKERKREKSERSMGRSRATFPPCVGPWGGVARPIRPPPPLPSPHSCGNVRACHVRCSRAIKGPN